MEPPPRRDLSRPRAAVIGILFHGPGVFDNGWAARLLVAFPGSRALLAGTLARTALVDSGLDGVECPGVKASVGVDMLADTCDTVILAATSKTIESGLALGSLVAEKSTSSVPLVQVETTGMAWSSCRGKPPDELVSTLVALGFQHRPAGSARGGAWKEGDWAYRRLHAPCPGDNIMVNGIFIGVARSDDILITTYKGVIQEVTNTDIKEHGLEKLERFGPFDITRAKVASTPNLRCNPSPAAVRDQRGSGVIFVDHAASRIFTVAEGCAGAVTVGDDTTAICGDILRRFSIPVIGITDGDGDSLYPAGGFAPGSLELLVRADDVAGLDVKAHVFAGETRTDRDFEAVKQDVLDLLQDRILSRRDH